MINNIYGHDSSKPVFSFKKRNTVNVDIFAYINFRVFHSIPSKLYSKSSFHAVHIFADFEKRELRENIYNANISTFTVGTNFRIEKFAYRQKRDLFRPKCP